MVYLYVLAAAVLGALGMWWICENRSAEERSAYAAEIGRLEKKLSHLGEPQIKYVERELDLQSIFCETRKPIEDLRDIRNAAGYMKSSIERRIGREILKFCDISMKVEPEMHQLAVRARLRVVKPEKNTDLEDMLREFVTGMQHSTQIGPLDFAAGNPGAARLVVEAYKVNAQHAEEGFLKMLTAGVTGDKLYMLWNDCCDRDTVLAMAAMNILPEEEILRHINYEGGRGIPLTDEEKEKLEYGNV